MTLSIERTVTREVEGTTWDRQKGCPCACGEPKPKVKRTMPWRDGVRERYHDCQACGAKFKSVEEDRRAAPRPVEGEERDPQGFRADRFHPLRRG